VKGYENNSNINVDWDYLNETPDIVSTVSKKSTVSLTKVSSLSDENIEKMYLDNHSNIANVRTNNVSQD